MNILYDQKLDLKNEHSLSHFQLSTDYSIEKKYNIVIASSEGVYNFIQQKVDFKKIDFRILIYNPGQPLVDIVNEYQPTHFFSDQETMVIDQKINELSQSIIFLNQKIKIRDSIELKRRELEKLNLFLVNQEKEKSGALKLFQEEEQVKKINEKKLLFFLDFLNTTYNKSHFLDELFKYLWIELKKLGSFYQIGFIISFESDSKSFIFQYDDRKFYSFKKIDFNFSEDNVSIQLANILQRPVGKIFEWQTNSAQTQFCLYFETQGLVDKTNLEFFVSQRIDLISIMINRWLLEKNETKLNHRWRDLFHSYTDPMHVINDRFEIVQSNYSSIKLNTKKCYNILAERESPCDGCPMLSPNAVSKQFVFKDESYTVTATHFIVNNQKYFLHFYENKTKSNILKSDLIQSEKMSTIGQLANHLAHELNNPLTGLKLTVDLLVSELESSSVNQNALIADLNEIKKATIRSEHIIKDLIDYSVNNPAQMQISDIEEIFKKTITLLKSILRNHKLFIDLKPISININSIYLQQVIFNLIKNACEAMKEPGVIKIYQLNYNQNFLEICIEDSGPGFDPEMVNHIFKPFFTTKSEMDGTGLGLYLCSKLMKKMNAELIYDMTYKKGTRFILRFKNDQSV